MLKSPKVASHIYQHVPPFIRDSGYIILSINHVYHAIPSSVTLLDKDSDIESKAFGLL